ncbi:glycosyltransferase family 2 protein [Arthrobacter sp. LAPM80]|uniref:glycosyltransferase n=1 Tax=Arthrobacter sp. LAPM80 TaxID=3141788 RepID=UPI00398B52D9
MVNHIYIRPTPRPQHSWTFITVTYNSASTLRSFWPVMNGNEDFEWIVVDNASTDNSADQAEALGATVIRLPKNLGFGAANNVGYQSSKSKYIAFINPDVSPQPEDLKILETHLNAHPFDLVSPQLINPDGSLQPNGRGLPYLLNKIQNRIRPSRLVDSYLKYSEPGESIKVSWLMGAVVAGVRDHLDDLGPWDEHFFVYYEDADLGLRNSKLSGDSVVIGNAQWYHGWARETKRISWNAWKLEIPSLIKFYSRYPHLLGAPGRKKNDSNAIYTSAEIKASS